MTLGARNFFCSLAALALLLAPNLSCSPDARNENRVRIKGSDTMLGLSAAWAEAFRVNHPDILVQVNGGGSGVGIAGLVDGKVQIATASRPMKPKEIEAAKKNNNGVAPVEFVVGRDALAIYVNKSNPIEKISLEQLAEIYGEDGKIAKWSDLGIANPTCTDGEIVRISRQNSSGTYTYFKEAVLGKKREYKQGATSQSGSSEIVALVSHTPCSIGYSGMGSRTDEVKVIGVSRKTGEPGVEPSVTSALDGTYPISRPLYLYTLGEPTGAVREFIQWVQSPEGQQIVESQGYIPNEMPKASEPAAKKDDAKRSP